MSEPRTVYNVTDDENRSFETHSLDLLFVKIRRVVEEQVRVEGFARVMVVDEEDLMTREFTVTDGGEEG